MRRLLDHVLVPDVRTEWLPWAWAAARKLIDAERPDVVIASHEPGVDLALGRLVKHRYGVPVLLDLGDPLLSPYAPRWRRRIDAAFERRWLAAGDLITVTTEATGSLLRARVPSLGSVRMEVLSQGFDDATLPDPPVSVDFSMPLELLYTGTLYGGFRHPRALTTALQGLAGARLTIIGHLEGIKPESLGRNVRFLGRLPHQIVRHAQSRADVLVNIANDSSVQMPGKVFEYLGACRPILHLAKGADDPTARLLAELGRAHIVQAGDASTIGNLLSKWLREGSGAAADGLNLDPESIQAYSWRALAGRLEAMLQWLVKDSTQPARCSS